MTSLCIHILCHSDSLCFTNGHIKIPQTARSCWCHIWVPILPTVCYCCSPQIRFLIHVVHFASHHSPHPFPCFPIWPFLFSMAPRDLCPGGTLCLIQHHVSPRIQNLFAKAKWAMHLAEEAAKSPLSFVVWHSLPVDEGMKCSACHQSGLPCTFQCSPDGMYASTCDSCHSTGAQCWFLPPFVTRPVILFAKTCTSFQSAHQCCTLGHMSQKCSHYLRHDLPCQFQVSVQGCWFTIAPQLPEHRWVTSCLFTFHWTPFYTYLQLDAFVPVVNGQCMPGWQMWPQRSPLHSPQALYVSFVICVIDICCNLFTIYHLSHIMFVSLHHCLPQEASRCPLLLICTVSLVEDVCFATILFWSCKLLHCLFPTLPAATLPPTLSALNVAPHFVVFAYAVSAYMSQHSSNQNFTQLLLRTTAVCRHFGACFWPAYLQPAAPLAIALLAAWKIVKVAMGHIPILRYQSHHRLPSPPLHLSLPVVLLLENDVAQTKKSKPTGAQSNDCMSTSATRYLKRNWRNITYLLVCVPPWTVLGDKKRSVRLLVSLMTAFFTSPRTALFF